MSGKLAGKVALLSGAGGTKGVALARLFASEGATVFMSDLDPDRVRNAADQVEPRDRIRHVKLDVREPTDWASAVQRIQADEGRLDVLVNSARVYGRGLVSEFEIDQWRADTAVNLDGPFLGAKYCLPLMVASGGGSIVSVVSVAAIRPNEATPAYSAANAGSLNLTGSIALQYARHGVRANAVVVGFSANSPLDEVHDLARRVVPLGRPNTAEDIARAVLFFACNDSAYATGTHLVLDGGRAIASKV